MSMHATIGSQQEGSRTGGALIEREDIFHGFVTAYRIEHPDKQAEGLLTI
jgi:hypothetical protein